MNLVGCSALVSGAGRGIGRGLVEGLLARGAATVYAGVRDLGLTVPDGAEPVLLDITDEDHVAAAAEVAAGVTLVVNNAGVNRQQSMLGGVDLGAARSEMDVNYFGTLSMCRAFVPVLEANGGGAIVNVLSVVSWFAPPEVGSYAASKSAQWALTNSLRVEVADRGIGVIGVHSGYVDTDMTAAVDVSKLAVSEVVEAVLSGVEAGVLEVVVDDRSRRVRQALSADLSVLYGSVGGP